MRADFIGSVQCQFEDVHGSDGPVGRIGLGRVESGWVESGCVGLGHDFSDLDGSGRHFGNF